MTRSGRKATGYSIPEKSARIFQNKRSSLIYSKPNCTKVKKGGNIRNSFGKFSSASHRVARLHGLKIFYKLWIILPD